MKELKFYIISGTGQSFTVQNGNVFAVNHMDYLKFSPDGWSDTSILYERNLQYHGIVRLLTTPYKFPGDGASILRQVVLVEGNIEKDLYLLLQVLRHEMTNTESADLYKTVFKGLFDLSSFNDDRKVVSISIGEKGLNKQFESKRDTIYQLNLFNDPNIQFLRNDGIAFRQSSNNLITNGSLPDDNGMHILDIKNVNTEELDKLQSFEVDRVHITSLTPEFWQNSDAFFLKTGSNTNDVTIDYRIDVNIQLQSGAPVNPTAISRWFISGRSPDNTELFVHFVAEAGTGSALYKAWSLKGSLTIPAVPPGTKLFLVGALYLAVGSVYAIASPGAADLVYWTYSADTSYFNIKYFYRHPPSYTLCFTPNDVARKLTAKITGEVDKYQDSALLTANEGILITSGDAVRRIQNSKVKLSLDLFFQIFNALLGAGLGIENNKVVIEYYDHFYNFSDDTIIDLGTVSDFEVLVAKDLLVNQVHIGYREQNANDVNGKMAFNTTAKYSLPVNSVNRTLDLVIDAIADPFILDAKRINLDGKTTTDDKSDNDICLFHAVRNTLNLTVDIYADSTVSNTFFISGDYVEINSMIPGMTFTLSGTTLNNRQFHITNVAPAGGGVNVTVEEPVTTESAVGVNFNLTYWVLNRNSTVTAGVPSPSTVYNVELSPAHMMNAQKPYLNSLLYGFTGQKMKFQTSDKNQALVSITNGVEYRENADVTVTDNRLFATRSFTFKASAPISLPDTMDATPNSNYRFTTPEGYTFRAICHKAGVALVNGAAQEFNMICGPYENLAQLYK